MNKLGFFKDHHETENTHADIWLLSRLAVASAAAMTVITFSVILG
jgi:hypothetical protein